MTSTTVCVCVWLEAHFSRKGERGSSFRANDTPGEEVVSCPVHFRYSVEEIPDNSTGLPSCDVLPSLVPRPGYTKAVTGPGI